MNNFVITIMDRNEWTSNTDIIILVNPSKKELTWIPRDMYVKEIDHRINAAYRMGRDKLLFESLKSINYDASYNLCILPNAINDFFNQIEEIKVPVDFDRSFFYPLHRHQPIENGKKIIEFKAPFETLKGDRFHEWIGARYGAVPNAKYSSDFDRIRRQQTLVKEILKTKKNSIKSYDETSIKGLNNEIIEVLQNIDDSWTFKMTGKIVCTRINNKSVVVYKTDI
jgi:anionic cell wall polymer biosynthesis LytR-Cps2A-Psr (LCP) family protein